MTTRSEGAAVGGPRAPWPGGTCAPVGPSALVEWKGAWKEPRVWGAGRGHGRGTCAPWGRARFFAGCVKDCVTGWMDGWQGGMEAVPRSLR
eukprot:356949-Chlamydomonas_euryale.AAC.1